MLNTKASDGNNKRDYEEEKQKEINKEREERGDTASDDVNERVAVSANEETSRDATIASRHHTALRERKQSTFRKFGV